VFLVAMAMAGVLTAAAPVAAHQRTIVSLEFDHAFSNALPAVQIANQHGMKVTLFAMSGRVGHDGYMTAQQLLALQAQGNEIGGHTIDHPDLSRLDPAAQRHEICDDRTALQAAGLRVTDFSYPYGYLGPATPSIVRSCGYQSARLAGGLGRGSDCGGPCPWVEKIPPPRPFRTRAESSVQQGTTLKTLERYVVRAEQAGGGWVQIVFHQVCDGCDRYSISESRFGRFVAWLARRRSNGTTARTVRRVISRR
jgi:peptidoglycan/xylan/chitin deacetylase (PgdA/CDA1 family)